MTQHNTTQHNNKLKEDIDNIVWWIPFRKLRNSIRNILIFQCEYLEKINTVENKINTVENKLDILSNYLNINTNIRKNEFSDIYRKSIWGNKDKAEGRSKSGSGSSLEVTSNLRLKLVDIIKRYNIKTFLDAPCGDMKWMGEILDYIENYIGIDIVNEIIEENKRKFIGINNIKLKCVDLLQGDIDKADLIFCRDCIQHLSNLEAQLLINNMIKSGSKYLLISTHSNESNDNRYKEKYSQAKALNLEKPPFNFPHPIEYLEEETFDKWIGYNRRMAL